MKKYINDILRGDVFTNQVVLKKLQRIKRQISLQSRQSFQTGMRFIISTKN